MSVSVCIEGIVEPNEEFQKMADAYRACLAAGVAIPTALLEYFKDEAPDPLGVIHDLGSVQYARAPFTAGYRGKYESGVILDLSKLPAGVTKLRVVYR